MKIYFTSKFRTDLADFPVGKGIISGLKVEDGIFLEAR